MFNKTIFHHQAIVTLACIVLANTIFAEKNNCDAISLTKYSNNPGAGLIACGYQLDTESLIRALTDPSISGFALSYIAETKNPVFVPELKKLNEKAIHDYEKARISYTLAVLNDNSGITTLTNICKSTSKDNYIAETYINRLRSQINLEDEICFDSIIYSFLNPSKENYVVQGVINTITDFKNHLTDERVLILVKNKLIIYMNDNDDEIRRAAVAAYTEIIKTELQHTLNVQLTKEKSSLNISQIKLLLDKISVVY